MTGLLEHFGRELIQKPKCVTTQIQLQAYSLNMKVYFNNQFMMTGLLESLDVEKDEDPPRLLRFLIFNLFDPS